MSSRSAANGKKDSNVSFNQTIRDAGFDNLNQFLLSHNLRMYNPDDVEEGKAILRAMFPERMNI